MKQDIVLTKYKERTLSGDSLAFKRRFNERIGKMLKQYRITSGKSAEAAAFNFRLTLESYLACESGLTSIRASDFAAGIRSYGFDAAFDALTLLNEIHKEFKSLKK